jgi:hypothetical protein
LRAKLTASFRRIQLFGFGTDQFEGRFSTWKQAQRGVEAMAPRESEPQKETVGRVMHEFKHGELRSGTGGQKVKSRRQAVAIGLSEAGASNQQSPKENREHLRPTKAKERRGETAQAEIEGKR